MNTWQQTLTIRTPEGVRFSFLLASPISRFLAVLIDWIVVMTLSVIVQTVLNLLGLLLFDIANAVALLSFFIISIGYPMLCEWLFRGQTIGKRCLKLRVIDASGLKLTISQVIVRNLLRAVDNIPIFYLLGGTIAYFSPRSQRLGDIVASTIVIQHLQHAEPDIKQLRSDKYNSMRDYPHICARLRQRTTPQEAAIAVDALLRREQFDDDARIDLFAELRAHFATKADFPESALHGISDERFIRNIVDAIYDTAHT